MIRKLIALLFSNPHMIQSLSETWPIRRAAKYTAYLYLRGKQAVEEGASKAADQQSFGIKENKIDLDFSRFRETFKSELKKGIQEAKDDIKRRQQ